MPGAGEDVALVKPPASLELKVAELHRHIRRLNLERVQELLDETPTLANAKGENGWAPLHCAVLVCHKPLVMLLLSKGADADTRMDNGYTPLHLISGLSPRVVGALIYNMRGELCQKETDGLTHLCFGSPGIQVDLARALISAGADINAADSNGTSCLTIARLLGNELMADLLLRSDAVYRARDEYAVMRGFYVAVSTCDAVVKKAVADLPLSFMIPAPSGRSPLS